MKPRNEEAGRIARNQVLAAAEPDQSHKEDGKRQFAEFAHNCLEDASRFTRVYKLFW